MALVGTAGYLQYDSPTLESMRLNFRRDYSPIEKRKDTIVCEALRDSVRRPTTLRN